MRVHTVGVRLVGILNALILAHERVAAHARHRRSSGSIVEQVEIELIPEEVYLIIGSILPKIITWFFEFGRTWLSLFLFLRSLSLNSIFMVFSFMFRRIKGFFDKFIRIFIISVHV